MLLSLVLKQDGTQGKEKHSQPFQPLLPLYLLIITCYIQHIALSPFLLYCYLNVFEAAVV